MSDTAEKVREPTETIGEFAREFRSFSDPDYTPVYGLGGYESAVAILKLLRARALFIAVAPELSVGQRGILGDQMDMVDMGLINIRQWAFVRTSSSMEE